MFHERNKDIGLEQHPINIKHTSAHTHSHDGSDDQMDDHEDRYCSVWQLG